MNGLLFILLFGVAMRIYMKFFGKVDMSKTPSVYSGCYRLCQKLENGSIVSYYTGRAYVDVNGRCCNTYSSFHSEAALYYRKPRVVLRKLIIGLKGPKLTLQRFDDDFGWHDANIHPSSKTHFKSLVNEMRDI